MAVVGRSRESVGRSRVSVERSTVWPIFVTFGDHELARKPLLPVFFVCLLVHGHGTAHISMFVWKMARVEPDSEATKDAPKRLSFPLSGKRKTLRCARTGTPSFIPG